MSSTAASVRAAVDHPFVDGDGHIVESIPVVIEMIRRVAGDDVADRFGGASPSYAARQAPLLARQGAAAADHRIGVPRTPWWALPADARDRATGMLPALLHERLDEIGLDFAVLYSSVALACIAHPDDAIRRGACRGLNTYLAEQLDGYGDRMTAAAVIPTHTPEEAIAELEHAVQQLGFRAVMLNNMVQRKVEGSTDATWLDFLALDSPYDYDPVWQRCIDLGVAVTVHTASQMHGLRVSSSRYMYNHIGNFAATADAFAKALVFGGVMRRFPRLHVAFLECGVSWAVQLQCDLVDRWKKRGGRNIERLDPRGLDLAEWQALFDRYGGDTFADPQVRLAMANMSDVPPLEIDDFRDCADSPTELVEQFKRFWFGCEADDPTISWAFDRAVNPYGSTLRPMLGSDIGHWDVVDMNDVLPEAYELIEDQRVDAAQFKAFACDNTIRLHGGMNPHFFDGTPVEAYARQLLASDAAATTA